MVCLHLAWWHGGAVMWPVLREMILKPDVWCFNSVPQIWMLTAFFFSYSFIYTDLTMTSHLSAAVPPHLHRLMLVTDSDWLPRQWLCNSPPSGSSGEGQRGLEKRELLTSLLFLLLLLFGAVVAISGLSPTVGNCIYSEIIWLWLRKVVWWV